MQDKFPLKEFDLHRIDTEGYFSNSFLKINQGCVTSQKCCLKFLVIMGILLEL